MELIPLPLSEGDTMSMFSESNLLRFLSETKPDEGGRRWMRAFVPAGTTAWGANLGPIEGPVWVMYEAVDGNVTAIVTQRK
jgi:hypothetical protein